ncbi:MAG: cytochrome c biogenesis protein CcsA [Bacteroidota bacterium]
MSGANFHTFYFIIISLWICGLVLFFLENKEKRKISNFGLATIALGVAVVGFYIGYLWILLERPPMRTLGETRLLYALFVPIIGFIIFYRWKIKWMIVYSIVLAAVFLTIDFVMPEVFNKTLMPALQSFWFVPHVIVYIFAYAILGFSTVIAIWGLFLLYKKTFNTEVLFLADNTVYVGFTFLTLGLLFGALWAKEAWGNYWTWDPKETWAFLTWLGYLLYIHLRIRHKDSIKIPLIVLSAIFVVLIICWFGINYLPSAQNSVHVYAN